MKTEIRRVNYDGKEDPKGMWWIWKENCNRCGSVIQNHTVYHSTPPEREKIDFCYSCLTYFMDRNISYKEVKEKYSLYVKNDFGDQNED